MIEWIEAIVWWIVWFILITFIMRLTGADKKIKTWLDKRDEKIKADIKKSEEERELAKKEFEEVMKSLKKK